MPSIINLFGYLSKQNNCLLYISVDSQILTFKIDVYIA
jgi:hypothetical protein